MEHGETPNWRNLRVSWGGKGEVLTHGQSHRVESQHPRGERRRGKGGNRDGGRKSQLGERKSQVNRNEGRRLEKGIRKQ